MRMKRRTFIVAAGAIAAWPFASHAQQAMPVIGFIHSASPSYFAQFESSVRDGLKEAGFVEHKNVGIEYRWAEGHYDRLPALVGDLIAHHVDAIFAGGGTDPAKAAKAATSTIPIVFISAADPVKTGLVASLNHPGGNVTGVSLLASALEAKKLDLLRGLVPKAFAIGALINPKYPGAKAQAAEFREAAEHLGVKAIVLSPGTEDEIDEAFASLAAQGAGALLVGTDPFFNSRHEQLAALAARYMLPAMFPQKEYVSSGGLISYGPHFADGYRQAGVYLGRVLKGEKPDDIPVMQPTRFEMVINLKTAKALGVSPPATLLAIADEVIE
jgi:putative ABC transport system substrate-binding protein